MAGTGRVVDPAAMGRVLVALVLAVLLSAGCGSPPGESSREPSGTSAYPTPPPTPGATLTQGGTPSARPSASPAATIPPELRGTWRAVLAPGDVATLEIGLGSYSISRVGRGSGGVRIVGADEVDLFGSDLCPGTGRYRWSADPTSLRLVAIEPDPCTGRADALAGRTYTRVP